MSSLGSRILAFATRDAPYTEFPLSTDCLIPLDVEVDLLDELRLHAPIDMSSIQFARGRLESMEAYELVIFATRMAVLAARADELEILQTGIVGLVIDDHNLVDNRDVLTALAIVHDCCERLGTSIDEAIIPVLMLAGDERRNVIRGFLSRDQTMRDVAVMGFATIGSGAELSYVSRRNSDLM